MPTRGRPHRSDRGTHSGRGPHQDDSKVLDKLNEDSDDDIDNNSTSTGEASCELGELDKADDESPLPTKILAEGFGPAATEVVAAEPMPEPVPDMPFDAPPGLPAPLHQACPLPNMSESTFEGPNQSGDLQPRVIQLFDELSNSAPPGKVPKSKKSWEACREMPDFGPPPGLEHPNGSPDVKPKRTQRIPGTRLRSKASPFVPVEKLFAQQAAEATSEFLGASHQLHKSISKLSGAVAEWETCLASCKDADPSNQARHESVASAGVSSSTTTSVKGYSVSGAALPWIKHGITAAPAMFFPMWQMHPDAKTSRPWQRFSHSTETLSGHQGQMGKAADMKATHPIDDSPDLESSPEQSTPDVDKDSLRTNLRDLEHMDSDRILIVRRINRLGLESSALLDEYFSQYGPVEKVLVSHSRAKAYFGYSSARVRPAGLGFVVMSCAEDAAKILQGGVEQVVNGAAITVHAYETRLGGQAKEPAEQMV